MIYNTLYIDSMSFMLATAYLHSGSKPVLLST